jgi:hypothetical protein
MPYLFDTIPRSPLDFLRPRMGSHPLVWSSRLVYRPKRKTGLGSFSPDSLNNARENIQLVRQEEDQKAYFIWT